MGNEKKLDVVIITGLSGAGKTTVLNCFEDIGFEVFDNFPLSLFDFLIDKSQKQENNKQLSFLEFLASDKDKKIKKTKPLAIGVDIRTRDFDINTLSKLKKTNPNLKILFIDCEEYKLTRRYTETRRAHPLAKDRNLVDGIKQEIELLTPIKNISDKVINTTENTPSDTKIIIENLFKNTAKRNISIFITSFSYKNGIPRDADLVFDVRFLKNPHYIPNLKNKTGLDEEVGQYIEKDDDFSCFFKNLTKLLEPLLPRYIQEGKNYLTIAFGCTGGQHRSVYLAEKTAQWLKEKNLLSGITHKQINKI